ncbi:MAG: DUF3489 domain-containing protein [Brevundimonas sp.]|jgi:hypothetical protein|nr:DUF3489 domain-containing protein [Brevundimonas sp.]
MAKSKPASKSTRPAISGMQSPERRVASRSDHGASKPPKSAGAPGAPAGKLGTIVALMRRPEGATVAQMSEATDWLPHSVRGALAGALKRKHGLTITSDKTDAGRVYRIADANARGTT